MDFQIQKLYIAKEAVSKENYIFPILRQPLF